MKSSKGSKEARGAGGGRMALSSYTSQPVTLALREAGTLSKRSCILVSPSIVGRRGRKHAYLVHACAVGKIGRSIVLGGDEHTVALSCCDIDHICRSLLGVNAIDFYNLHSMTLEPDILSGKSSDVDDAKQVSLSGLDCSSEVLRVVEQGRFWHWLCSRRIEYADKGLEKIRHEVMVPVRHSQDSLLVVLAFVGRVWISDDERAPHAVWILGQFVSVIPVRPRLINL